MRIAKPPPFSGDGGRGLGWQIGKYRNEGVIYHHGGYPGYRSNVSFMPYQKVALGVLIKSGRGKVSIVRYIFALE